MYSFGSQNPRALESFGVSGLLAKEALVFYHSIFDITHMGRISDLVLVRLRKEGIDEFKLRVILIISVFQASQGRFLKNKALSDFYGNPLLFECGVDFEKLVFGISFNIIRGANVNVENLSERVFKGTPLDDFESSLIELSRYSDRIILKYQPSTQRVEINTVIGIPGKINSEFTKSKTPLEVLVFEKVPVPQAPRPDSYINLGDLDATQLLSTGPQTQKIGPHGVRALQRDEADETRVSGHNDSLFNTDLLHVKSQSGFEEDASWSKLVKGAKNAIKSLMGSVFSKKPNLDELESGGEELQILDQDLLKTPDLIEYEEMTPVPITEEPKTSDESSLEVKGSVDLKVETDKLIEALRRGGLSRVPEELKTRAPDMIQGGKSKRTSIWVESLSKNLIAERAHLHDLSKKVYLAARMREVEFHNQINATKEELKQKESLLLQKESALIRTKEQLAQVNKNFERLRISNRDDAEEGHYKQKYQLADKMFTVLKDEKTALTRKIDELKFQLGSAQTKIRSQDNSAEGYARLQIKYEHAMRQVEEFKKTNRQLLDHIHEPQTEGASGGGEELKRRLSAAMKLLMKSKKEGEEVKRHAILLQQTKLELQNENIRLKSMLRKLSLASRNSEEGTTSEGGGAVPPNAA